MGFEEVRRRLSEWKARLGHFRGAADLGDELRTHLEMQAEDNAAAGLPEAEARRRARLRLGNTQAVVENVRDREFITMVESWYRDLRLGIRALRKSPVFCLTAILTLAIGIGANTAVFTVLYGLLLRSLPVPDAQDLVRIGMVNAANPRPLTVVPYRMIEQLQRQQRSFTGISAWGTAAVTMKDREGTMRLYYAGLVSGNSFEVLKTRPHLGRLITPTDDVRGGPPEGVPVVLSYGFWLERFGGDPNLAGNTITLSASTGFGSKGPLVATIVGVAPRDFGGIWPGLDPKLYLPIQALSGAGGEDRLNSTTSAVFFAAIGRLAPGISIGDANAEIAVYQEQLLTDFIPPDLRRRPDFQITRLTVDSARTGLPTFFGERYSAPLYLMQGLVAVVLLLCCINVSGLMMSKVYERQREFAVRTAIGAARWRLIRQYLTESFVIALAGAGLGAVVAWHGSTLLLQFFRDPNMGFWMSVEPDRIVFLATGAFAVLTTLFFGILPALRAGRSDSGVLLKSRTEGAHRQRAGRAFVPVQVSLSLVLVALATLLSQSLTRIRSEYTGFDVDYVTIQTPPFNMLPQQGEAKLDVYQRMVDRLEQAHGIRSASVTWYTPMTGRQATAAFQALSESPGGGESLTLAYNSVGPGYFRTMKTKILAGREFSRAERRRDLCILNESAAAYLFPRQQALGNYIRSADSKEFPETVTCRVIGLAEDAKFASLREPPPRTIYFPLTKDNAQGHLVFLMNSQTKAQAIAGYREALREIAPSIPLVLFATLREQMDAALGSQRAITAMSSFFGGLALFLSAIGLYGMLSSSVAQRTGEIGVRVALGAQRNAVLRMILWDALRLVGIGIAIGTIALYFAVQSVEKMLYGVSSFDPATLLASGMLLTLVALLAGFIPALRAASIDPLQALRGE